MWCDFCYGVKLVRYKRNADWVQCPVCNALTKSTNDRIEVVKKPSKKKMAMLERNRRRL